MSDIFKNKKDYSFTTVERVIVRDSFLRHISQKDSSFNQIIGLVSSDLNLTKRQITAALIPNKEAKRVLKELHKKQHELHKAKKEAITYIQTANYPKIIRFLRLYSFWRFLKNKNSN